MSMKKNRTATTGPSHNARRTQTFSSTEHSKDHIKVSIQETGEQSFSGESSDQVESDGLGASELCIAPSSLRGAQTFFGDIESDAARNFRDRDAPGQNCVYIPSGDHRTEIYRLATYSRYPETAPVKSGDLAAAGLYYTGYKDRVKCFSCGMAVENWVQGDDGMDKQWHKSDCRLIKGTDNSNIPLPTPNFRTMLREYKGLPTSLSGTSTSTANQSGTPRDVTDVTANFSQVRLSESNYPVTTLANITTPGHEAYLKRINLRSEAERRKTYEQWPSYPAPHLIGELAKDGFFYLGNLDRTQCFACSGVLRNWSGNDVVRDQHRKHFPRCGFLLGLAVGNIPMTNAAREQAQREERARLDQLNANNGEPPDPPQDQQRHLALAYPCNNPINRHMVSLQRRIETFDTRWPSTRINAAVEDIAKAGFFFLGESDKTKCFYCNGGLQNWDPNDEPWTEHAKWFPGCEFVLRKKGVDFARRIADAHPNLNRPYIRNPVPFHDIPPSNVRRTASGEAMETTPTTPIDTDRIVNDLGFSRAAIDRAMERRRNEGGEFANENELVQYLLDHSEEDQNEVVNTSGASASSTAIAAGQKREGEHESSEGNKKTRRSVSPSSSASLDDEMANLREMEQAGMCKSCRNNRSEMVIIPCGHLCMCEDCSKTTKRCPICKLKIQKTVKVYRA